MDWNRLAKEINLPAANPWLNMFGHLIPVKGSALDLAYGLEQNAFFLVKHALSVDTWDSYEVAIKAVNDLPGSNS